MKIVIDKVAKYYSSDRIYRYIFDENRKLLSIEIIDTIHKGKNVTIENTIAIFKSKNK